MNINLTLMLGFVQGSLWFQWPLKPTCASLISCVKAGFVVAFPDAKMSQQTMKDVTKKLYKTPVTCHLKRIRSEFHVIFLHQFIGTLHRL